MLEQIFLKVLEVIRGIPVDFGEGDTEGRIKNLASLRKTKKAVLAVVLVGVAILIICLASTRKALGSEVDNLEAQTEGVEKQEILEESQSDELDEADKSDKAGESDKAEEPEQLMLSLDIKKHYVTRKGDPGNFYDIDQDKVLWGSGKNDYGQLGQGTQNYEFRSEKVKIAENVIHVDYSQNGFVIFLTEDHKLYGMGNSGCGALQQYEEFDWGRYTNGYHYIVTTPILLMEDVIYACCGRTDVVCLKEDGTAWTWGTIYLEGGWISPNVYYLQKPKKILEDAVLVTGGWFNHAALLQDGTVWTWGYNMSGNCGVAESAPIGEPTMVAENVVMVWTDLAVDGYPQPGAEEIAMAWTGRLQYHMEYDDIAEFGEFYPRYLNNTVIQKADGSYWVCGENVGTEERTVHGQEADYTVICTHEFYPCQ